MSKTSSAADADNSLFAHFLGQTTSLFTPKRIGYSVFGTFAFVGVAAALDASAGSTPSTVQTPQFKNTQQLTASPTNISPEDSTASSATNTNVSANSSDAGTHVKLTVNGQNVPVPANTTTSQTTTSPDGTSQTTTTTSANTTNQGTAINNNSASVSINVTNSSTTTGSTTP